MTDFDSWKASDAALQNPGSAAALLAEMLRPLDLEQNPSTCRWVIDVLGSLGQGANVAVPALRRIAAINHVFEVGQEQADAGVGEAREVHEVIDLAQHARNALNQIEPMP